MRSLLLAVVVFAAAVPAAVADTTPNTFKTVCNLVATSPQQMDPIVYPDRSQVGHLHEFFGNTQINPFSTGFSLQIAGAASHTTCADRFDTADYWVPTLYRNGVRIPPVGIDVYYQRIVGLTTSTGAPINKVVEPPTDFRLIAGERDAVSPQPVWVEHWACYGAPEQAAAPPACAYNPSRPLRVLSATVMFPGCWDGGNDRLANNTNNATYIDSRGQAKRCPAGHGVQVPFLTLTVHYDNDPRPDCHLVSSPDPGVNCDTYTLSENVNGLLDTNSSIYGYHADWLNGWSNGPDRVDPLDKSFGALISRCDNDPNGATACDVQSSTPTGDAFLGTL